MLNIVVIVFLMPVIFVGSILIGFNGGSLQTVLPAESFVEMYLERYGMQGYIYSGILCVVLFIALFFILLFKNRYFARNRGEFYGKY